MIDKDTYTLVNAQSGELAFKLYKFESIRHFDHVQRLNYYSLIWIKEGSGNALVDIASYAYQGGYLFCLSPYQPFLFEPQEQTSGVIINFHPDFFCIHKHHKEVSCDGILFNNIYHIPWVKVDDQHANKLNWIINELEEDILKNDLVLNEAVLSYLKLFLISSSRLKKEQTQAIDADFPKDDIVIVQKLKNFIETHYKTKHSPKEYANLLFISPNALAKITKTYFNKTLTALISERIIIEAKRELYLTAKTIEEIALELGYEDQFYFSRFFKKHTDIAPSIYRNTVGFNKGNEKKATVQ